MGRPQKEIRSFTTPAGELAAGLRDLQRRAHTTYREMAEKTGYAPSTFSKAASGDRMPTWEVCSAFVECCNGDVTDWTDRWSKAQARDTMTAEAHGETPRRGRHASHTQIRRRAPAPHPRYATTIAEFVKQLGLLKTWTDLTLAQIAAQSAPDDPQSTGDRRPGPTLCKSTISDALRGTKLPKLQFVEQFVKACGGTDAEVQAWADTWRILQCREITNAGGNPGDAVQQMAKVVGSPSHSPMGEPSRIRELAPPRTAPHDQPRKILANTGVTATQARARPSQQFQDLPDGSVLNANGLPATPPSVIDTDTSDRSLAFLIAVIRMPSTARALDSALASAHDLAYEISTRLDRVLARRLNARLTETLMHDLDSAADCARILELEIDRAHALAVQPSTELAAVLAHEHQLGDAITLAYGAACGLLRDLDRGLPLDQARKRALILARDLAGLRTYVHSLLCALDAVPVDVSGIDRFGGLIQENRGGGETQRPHALAEYITAESDPHGVGVFSTARSATPLPALPAPPDHRGQPGYTRPRG